MRRIVSYKQYLAAGPGDIYVLDRAEVGRGPAEVGVGLEAERACVGDAAPHELAGEVGEVERSVRPYLVAAAGVAVVAVVGVAYLLGRRRGKRTTTVVEVRRL